VRFLIKSAKNKKKGHNNSKSSTVAPRLVRTIECSDHLLSRNYLFQGPPLYRFIFSLRYRANEAEKCI